MKHFGKCMTFLLIAALALGAQTTAFAAEDNPGTYYGNNAAAAPEAEQPSYTAPAYHKSVEEFEEENDAIGVPRNSITQSPSLRYDGVVIGDDANYSIDLEDVLTEEQDEIALANASTDTRIANSTDNTRSETASQEAAATEAADEADADKEYETPMPISNPDTGRTSNALPIVAAGILFASAIPFAVRKSK